MGASVPCRHVPQLTIPLTTAVPAGWTFTRSGATATYWANGTLVGPVAANVPRFESDANGNLLGYLNEPAATNIYLNSQAPATQTITVTAQAYTLSFYGTGTIVLTGTYTGTLTGTGAANLVQLTFTPTAGSLITTLTGTVTNVQLEAGSFATSRIITAGASVTRNTDNLTAPLSLYPWLQTSMGWTAAIEFSLVAANQVGQRIFELGDGTTSNRVFVQLQNSTGGITVNSYVAGVSSSIGNYATNAIGTLNSYAESVNSAGVAISLNRAATHTLVNAGLPKMSVLAVGRSQQTGGTGQSAIHVTSVTLRAGPSTAAWLQGGSY
jgi:hypothetical protein